MIVQIMQVELHLTKYWYPKIILILGNFEIICTFILYNVLVT